MLCATGGLLGIIYYKSESRPPIMFPFYTMYSPHSWIGVTVLGFWGIQFLVGLAMHLKPNLFPDDRDAMKYHRFFGMFIYSIALATCAMGFQDMQSSDLAGSTAPNANVTFAEMLGYFPNSRLAQYSGAGSIMLLLAGLTTFANFIR